MAELVGVNEKGKRVGQYHHNARFTDHDVDLMFELYNEGRGLRIVDIARRFECRRSVVNDILKGRRRSQTPSRWVRVKSRDD